MNRNLFLESEKNSCVTDIFSTVSLVFVLKRNFIVFFIEIVRSITLNADYFLFLLQETFGPDHAIFCFYLQSHLMHKEYITTFDNTDFLINVTWILNLLFSIS